MTETDKQGKRRSFRERFPSVARLEYQGSRRKIPYVQQTNIADCGAACLTMVLCYHGRNARLDQVRDYLGVGRDGTSAVAIMDGARSYGLRGRAVRLELEGLEYLSRGSILHWRLNHFVVLDRVRRGGIEIVDPASGRRFVSSDELGKSFTGVAIEFEKTSEFDAGGESGSLIWFYVRRILGHSGLLMRIVSLSAFVQVIGLALPVLMGTVVDRVVPRGDANLLGVIIAGIAIIAVFSFLTSYIRAQLMLRLRTSLDLKMTFDFLDHMMRLPFSFFQLRQTGDLMMRLNSNTTIRETLASAAISALLDGILVTSYLVIMLITYLPLGLCVMGLGLLRVLIYLVSRRKHRELMAQCLQSQVESSNYQVQMLTGIETLKAAGAENYASSHWSNLFVDVMNAFVRRGKLNAVVQSSLDVLGTTSPLLLLGYGAYLVMNGDLTLGTMLAMNALAAGFLVPLSPLVNTALSLQTLRSYIDRVEDVVVRKPEQSAGQHDPAPKLDGNIRLNGVSFRYSKHAPLVVNDVSFEIEKGATIAFVGRSGSGKSTLARLIVGLMRPVSGEITYDGRSMDDYDIQSFRRQFGFVPQNPFLFGSSIRANITITCQNLPLADVERAATMACIHDDIMDMPLNYNTIISVAGASLSGGQRQRIALARALVNNPPILVLDETTSHLDALTEARVQENLSKLDCTRIFIAHRLSTVISADRIFVMDQGKIIEQGTHKELLTNGGAYAQLVASQMKRRDIAEQ